ncbi:hypothetical protein FK530_19205 [Tsukamurella conjunctivitidis]|uniref:Holin n=1 Tax=Tsukamurella conjunctivitidis TaxID=2592068 RepID=A0A5C5RYJ0_9ACTN|nr:hypothetical protein [Tsukamurella conjunctivitidis]TWS27275.1 hypothetical protein FK530_19205 [Tsukamurella conjunctivitidis]
MAHRAPEQSSTVTDVIAWLTPDRRRWLYGILTVAAPILVVYGIVEQETVTLWLSLAATILIGGTAALHTPKTS